MEKIEINKEYTANQLLDFLYENYLQPILLESAKDIDLLSLQNNDYIKFKIKEERITYLHRFIKVKNNEVYNDIHEYKIYFIECAEP